MNKAIFILLFLLFTFKSYSQTELEKLFEAYSNGKYQEAITLAEKSIQQKPNSFDVLYYKGLSEQALSKFKEASETFTSSLSFTKDSVPVLFSLGNCLESAGDDEGAIKNYQLLLSIDSTYNPAKARLAAIYKSQREYGKAIEWYSKLVQADTTNGFFYSQLAWCCNRFGLFEPVVPYYLKAIELNPNDIRSINELISALVDAKYYDDAQYYCDTFLFLFPNNIKILKQQAYVTALQGNDFEAVKQFQYITGLGDSSLFTCKYYGQSLYNNGQYPEAVFWLNKYIKAQPDDSKNQFILGLACQKDYQYEKSLTHLGIALQQLYDPDLIARMYEETGNTYSKFADYTQFRDSTKTKSVQMYKSALEYYLLAESLNTRKKTIYKTLGNFYKEKMKDKKIALYYFEKYRQNSDLEKMNEFELMWLNTEINRLKEELHFMGD